MIWVGEPPSASGTAWKRFDFLFQVAWGSCHDFRLEYGLMWCGFFAFASFSSAASNQPQTDGAGWMVETESDSSIKSGLEKSPVWLCFFLLDSFDLFLFGSFISFQASSLKYFESDFLCFSQKKKLLKHLKQKKQECKLNNLKSDIFISFGQNRLKKGKLTNCFPLTVFRNKYSLQVIFLRHFAWN